MKEDVYAKMENFRNVMYKLTSDRKMFRGLIESYIKEDFQRFRDILSKLELRSPTDCPVVCQYVCLEVPILTEDGRLATRKECEMRCRNICQPNPEETNRVPR